MPDRDARRPGAWTWPDTVASATEATARRAHFEPGDSAKAIMRRARGLAHNRGMPAPTSRLPQEGLAEHFNRDSSGFRHNLNVPGAAAAGPLLADPEGEFARNYNRKTFSFAHGLAGH